MIKKRDSEGAKLNTLATRALKSAVRKLIKQHKKNGEPLIIWRNGRVVKVPAHKL